MEGKNRPGGKTAGQILIDQINDGREHVLAVVTEQGKAIFGDQGIMPVEDIQDFSVEFIELFVMLLEKGDGPVKYVESEEFAALKKFFSNFAKQLQARGGDLKAFVRYVHALQRTLIEILEVSEKYDFDQTRDSLLLLARVFNKIVLDVFNTYLMEKEQIIKSHEEELRQVSAPITEIWDGVLTLPIIGRLDSSRAMMVMENLLTRIEKDRSKMVVMDVTGVLAIDSQVSHHLIQMVRAIGLMGADSIITGIRPNIARALTDLNIDLSGVATKSTLSDGLKEAFKRLGIHVKYHESL